MQGSLNERALVRCEELVAQAELLRVAVHQEPGAARVIDCGVTAEGGLEAGRQLAAICMADLGRVELVDARPDIWTGPAVQVTTDSPAAACMASQYAGWQIRAGKFFAMGSGPMRAAYGGEDLFETIPFREQAQSVVGVLETNKLPPPEAGEMIAKACNVRPDQVTLLVAPTSSLAGTIQVVARSIETCLHKLHELGFPLERIKSGHGVAPLPPIAGNDLEGIGRTNDAILYGGHVTLWVRGDDDELKEIGKQVPSSASLDWGQPFAEIFERYDHDFYKIDSHLFSPAVVTLVNLDTGRWFRFGQLRPDVLDTSFGGA